MTPGSPQGCMSSERPAESPRRGYHSIVESYNIQVGRDPQGSWSPTPGSPKDCPKKSDHVSAQLSFCAAPAKRSHLFNSEPEIYFRNTSASYQQVTTTPSQHPRERGRRGGQHLALPLEPVETAPALQQQDPCWLTTGYWRCRARIAPWCLWSICRCLSCDLRTDVKCLVQGEA